MRSFRLVWLGEFGAGVLGIGWLEFGDGFSGREREAAAAAAAAADDAAAVGEAGVGVLAHVRRVPEHAGRGREGLRVDEHGRAPPQHLDGRGVARRRRRHDDDGDDGVRGGAEHAAVGAPPVQRQGSLTLPARSARRPSTRSGAT